MPGSIYEAAGEIGAVRSEVGKAECGHRNLEIAGTKELLRLN